jgi:hypothetical protein
MCRKLTAIKGPYERTHTDDLRAIPAQTSRQLRRRITKPALKRFHNKPHSGGSTWRPENSTTLQIRRLENPA